MSGAERISLGEGQKITGEGKETGRGQGEKAIDCPEKEVQAEPRRVDDQVEAQWFAPLPVQMLGLGMDHASRVCQ